MVQSPQRPWPNQQFALLADAGKHLQSLSLLTQVKERKSRFGTVLPRSSGNVPPTHPSPPFRDGGWRWCPVLFARFLGHQRPFTCAIPKARGWHWRLTVPIAPQYVASVEPPARLREGRSPDQSSRPLRRVAWCRKGRSSSSQLSFGNASARCLGACAPASVVLRVAVMKVLAKIPNILASIALL